MPNFTGLWTANQQFQAVGGSTWPSFPGAPTSAVATATSGTAASVAFTAPSSTGYPASITGYIVTSSPGGLTGTGASSPISVTGLTTNTAYTFTVRAINATGTGPSSAASNSVTPVNAFVEDVFSTYLYAGTNANITINNGIDLAGKGGLVWQKQRTYAIPHRLFTTAMALGAELASNSTGQLTNSGNLTAYSSTGFTLFNALSDVGQNYVTWTFRKQPKFFDVVTYTGTGTTAQNISHNLGAVPGCIIIKRTDSTSDWGVVHRSTNAYANYGYVGGKLNTTGIVGQSVSEDTGIYYTNSTTFQVDEGSAYFNPNASGGTYVAYLFAHDAGGFGLTGTDNVISCGSFTTDGSGNATVSVGYEPQWVMYKGASGTGAISDWVIADTMRGYSLTGGKNLAANSSQSEGGLTGNPTATSFVVSDTINTTYIYIAIRRGPMKVPTLGTSVFQPYNAADNTTQTVGFPTDMYFDNNKTGASYNTLTGSRLIGKTLTLSTSLTDAETTSWGPSGSFDSNTTFAPTMIGAGTVWYSFRRAPGFFDEVCYNGTGASNQTKTHNLGVTPELMIIKNRGPAGYTQNWTVYPGPLGTDKYMFLNSTAAAGTFGSYWADTPPTSTGFTVGNYQDTNASTLTYVAYLFATCAGVSKVGSYSGTATTKQIDCGFTAGARFVLIKRTDSSGDWYMWDTARGIIAGNDPYLLLNSAAAEVTNTDYIDAAATGFELSSTAPAALNANGGTYIFLAIA